MALRHESPHLCFSHSPALLSPSAATVTIGHPWHLLKPCQLATVE